LSAKNIFSVVFVATLAMSYAGEVHFANVFTSILHGCTFVPAISLSVAAQKMNVSNANSVT
jgi:hypothetical protein